MRKKTLPVLYAMERAGPEDRERLIALYRQSTLTEDEVAEARAIIERSGAAEYTRAQALRHRDEALRQLDATGAVAGEARERLHQIVRSAISA